MYTSGVVFCFDYSDCAQTAVFLGGCFAFEGLLVHLLSSINTLRSIHVARSVILIHAGVLLMCFVFGLVWHRAVTKVRVCFRTIQAPARNDFCTRLQCIYFN